MIWLYQQRQYKDITMSTQFLFRFPDENVRREFKILAVSLNKSMNELLGEIVVRYLKEIKEA